MSELQIVRVLKEWIDGKGRKRTTVLYIQTKEVKLDVPDEMIAAIKRGVTEF